MCDAISFLGVLVFAPMKAVADCVLSDSVSLC